MPFLKIVKRIKNDNYCSLDGVFILTRSVDTIFSFRKNTINSEINIYVNNIYSAKCLDLIGDNIDNLTCIQDNINCIKKRHELYLSSFINTIVAINNGLFSSSRCPLELDINYCHDKVDLKQIEDIINKYNELQNCSDVDHEDIRLVLIDN